MDTLVVEHISLREAARRLGVSPTQASRYAQSGRLTTIGTGRARRVLWTDGGAPGAPGAPSDAPPVHPPVHDAALVIARCDAEIAFLRAALEREQVASAELRRLLAAEQQRRLPAPVESVAPHAERAESRSTTVEPTTEPPARRRPWWWLW